MPNPPLPFEKVREYLSRRLLGQSRDEAVEGLMSTGSGSDVWDRFVRYAGEHGVKEAGREYGVEEELEDCLRVSADSRALGVSVKESYLGLQIHRKFDEMGVPRERQPAILRILTAAAQYDRPESVLETSAQVIEAQKKSGLLLSDMLVHYDKRVKDFKEAQEREVARKVAVIEEAQARSAKEIEGLKAESLTAVQDERQKFEAEKVAELEDNKRKTLAEQAKAAEAREELGVLNGKIASATSRQGKIAHILSQEEAELKEFKQRKDQAIRRTDAVEREIAAMAAYGVNRPEDRVKVLAEVEKLGGSARKLVELVRRYDGMEAALTSVRTTLTRVKGQVSKTEDRERAVRKRLAAGTSKLKLVTDQYEEANIALRVQRQELRSLLVKLSQALGVKADLTKLRQARDRAETAFKDFRLRLRTSSAEYRRKKRGELRVYAVTQRKEIHDNLAGARTELKGTRRQLRKVRRELERTRTETAEAKGQLEEVQRYLGEATDEIGKLEARLADSEPLAGMASVFKKPAEPVNAKALRKISLVILEALKPTVDDTPIPLNRPEMRASLEKLSKILLAAIKYESQPGT